MAALKSVHAGLRARELTKDTYERLYCATCGDRLDRRAAHTAVDTVLVCPACSKEWRNL